MVNICVVLKHIRIYIKSRICIVETVQILDKIHNIRNSKTAVENKVMKLYLKNHIGTIQNKTHGLLLILKEVQS